MFTTLDLLVVAFLVLTAATLCALSLMFLLKNSKAKKVFFYIACGLGLYLSWGGLSMGLLGMFTEQIVIGLLTAVMCVASFAVERIGKGNEKMFLAARIVSAAALVLGMANAFMI